MLAEALTDASPDLMRSLLQTMIDALLSADVDAVVGAEWGLFDFERGGALKRGSRPCANMGVV